jgi:predicted ATPase
MHAFYTYLEQNPSPRGDIAFHERSHGESFLDLVFDRFEGSGLFVLDEPESALSFSGSLSLITALTEQLANPGAQVIMSTHSPLVAALPGATIYEVGEWGLRETAWDDLELVQSWRAFFARPHLFLDSSS